MGRLAKEERKERARRRGGASDARGIIREGKSSIEQRSSSGYRRRRASPLVWHIRPRERRRGGHDGRERNRCASVSERLGGRQVSQPVERERETVNTQRGTGPRPAEQRPDRARTPPLVSSPPRSPLLLSPHLDLRVKSLPHVGQGPPKIEVEAPAHSARSGVRNAGRTQAGFPDTKP